VLKITESSAGKHVLLARVASIDWGVAQTLTDREPTVALPIDARAKEKDTLSTSMNRYRGGYAGEDSKLGVGGQWYDF